MVGRWMMEAWVSDLIQVVAVGIMFLTYRQSRSNGRVIQKVEHATNGLTAKLVKVTGEAKYAEGVKDQKEGSAT